MGRRAFLSAKPPLGTPVNWSDPISAGLIGAWEFNDNGGSVVHDSTGRYGDGDLINAPTWGTQQKGVDLSFSAASTEYVQVLNNPSIPLTSEYTVEVLVWLNSLRNYNGLVTKTISNIAHPLDAYVDNGGNLHFFPNSLGGGIVTTVGAAQWLLLHFLQDGKGAFQAIYVNGALKVTGNDGTIESPTTNSIFFGNRADNVTALDGRIARVRIWNRKLQPAEVQRENVEPFGIFQRPRIFPSLAASTGPQTVSPTGVTSSFAAGSATVVDYIISPGGVISGLAIGVPLVSGRNPLPLGVASGFAAGTLSVLLQQIVSPTGVASGEAVGVPRTAHVQVVSPGGVASGEAEGTPTITGAAQFILPRGPGPGLVGVPSVLGGPPQLHIWMGGIDIGKTHGLSLGAQDPSGGSGGGSAPTIQSQTIGRWQAQFDLWDNTGTFAPALGQTVILAENNFKLFAGCLVDIKSEWFMGTQKYIVYHCTASDKSSICDHRVVKSAFFAAGSDAAAAILSIVSQSLNGEGITAQGVPDDGSLGVLNADTTFNFNTVTQAFDQIATDTGTVWFVDVNGVLNFNSLNSLPMAPFSINATSNNFSFPVVEQSLLNYRNTQYAVSNLTILPGASGQGGTQPTALVESFTWALGQPGIVQGFDSSGNPIPAFVNTSLPVSTVTSITVNGVPQTVVDYANFNGQTSTGPNDHVWFYSQQSSEMGPSQHLPLPTNAAVVVSYIPYTNNASVQVGAALDPTSPVSGGTFGTCGSGVYEAVEQVQNISTSEDLTAIAQALLSRYGGIPTIFTFQTDQAGLQPGQLLNVNLTVFGNLLNNVNLLITQVTGVSLGRPLEFGNSFRWQVQAQSVRDLGNWIKWFENLVKRTQNALPVYQYEIAAFVLAPGGSLVGGTVITNPYIVKRTGLMFDMYASADTPPQDQNLILQMLINGSLVTLGNVTIPANSTPQAQFRFTFPTSSPLYVFAGSNFNDIVTVQAQYQVTGPNPEPASNVSFDIRWRM